GARRGGGDPAPPRALPRLAPSPAARLAPPLGPPLRVLAEPGSLSDADVAEVRAHGWSDRVIAEVVGVVTLNLLTGAFNLLAGIQPESEE
ncbi:alkylhydroperoxidase, partial [Streptomyces sp. NPDC057540]